MNQLKENWDKLNKKGNLYLSYSTKLESEFLQKGVEDKVLCVFDKLLWMSLFYETHSAFVPLTDEEKEIYMSQRNPSVSFDFSMIRCQN